MIEPLKYSYINHNKLIQQTKRKQTGVYILERHNPSPLLNDQHTQTVTKHILLATFKTNLKLKPNTADTLI